MQSLVFIQDNQPVTTSLVIADHCQYDHASVIKLVRNHIEDLGEFGEVGFEIRLNPQGSPTEYAILNEQQATYLITLMNNNPVVRQFKKNLVKAFFQMRDALRLGQPEPDYYKRVDVTMQHVRGITNNNGLDIKYTLDLTKICLRPNRTGLQLLERITGVDMSDILPEEHNLAETPVVSQLFDRWEREHLVEAYGVRTPASLIFGDFREWYQQVTGLPVPSQKWFGGEMVRRRYRKDKIGGLITYIGVALSSGEGIELNN